MVAKKSKAVSMVIKMGILLLLITASIELASSLAFRILHGTWSHTYHANPNRFIFEPHPYLIGSLKKNAEYEREGLIYSHNSDGYRGKEFPKAKSEGLTRIVTIGGSTTYGVGVNNEETWPYHLETNLGEGYEVFNLGVPGYTTAENLIQTGLHLSEQNADIAIYFVGLNDMRNVNINGLKSDYSDFHAPTLHSALGLCRVENVPSLASIRMFLIVLQKVGLTDSCPHQNIDVSEKTHTGVDLRALALYKRNLQSITALCESQGVKVLFVPHVLLEEVLKTGDYKWWIPFIPTAEIDDMMEAYNSTLKEVSISNNVVFADSVLNHVWNDGDFVDMSHFNADANRRFAEIVALYVKAIDTSQEPGVKPAN